jgi:hypothetical protein
VQALLTSTSAHRHPEALAHTGLPILEVALDVASMQARLAPFLQTGETLRYARVVAYKAENRGLLRYDVVGPDGAFELLGKVYPDAEHAARAEKIMRHLDESVFAATQYLHVPHAVGTLPDLRMLVYRPAPGRFLDELLDAPQAATYLDGVAAWLVALQSASVPLERRISLSAEMVNSEAWAGVVGRVFPELAVPAEDVASRLARNATRLRFRDDIAVHKDLHYRHVLVADGVHVIDFDEMRLGDPNFDVAHFAASLFLIALREPGLAPQVPALARTFVDCFTRRSGWEPDARYPFFYAYTCLKMARQIATVRGVRPRPDGAESRRQAAAILREGSRWLA